MYLGIEIGGTKLQLGVGPGDGSIAGLWRGRVDPVAGAEGIRQQIVVAIPELLRSAKVAATRVRSVGIGFGGPVNDANQCIIKSHQIAGWDNFPLSRWLSDTLSIPVIMGNDADVAGLAEADHGAGQGCSPLFYMTIGSGIGGGLIIDGEIYRGVGQGAAEIGHLRVTDRRQSELAMTALENIASGWSIGRYARQLLEEGKGRNSLLWKLVDGNSANATAERVGEAVRQGDLFAVQILSEALASLAEALCAVIVLLCPLRIVIGGGVSLIGDKHFFAPLRELVATRVFAPFAGLTEIVPAALGEAVVVHGALALARRLVKR